jgi:phosphoglycolate phosphatase
LTGHEQALRADRFRLGRHAEELAEEAERTLMIGDTVHDLLMAANAGVAALAVGHGAHPREKLLPLGPIACVDSMAQLQRWLHENA